MPILLAALAATIIAAVAIASVLLLRRTSVSIIIRKDPDMATLKQRLAVLEADNADLKSQIATLTGQIADHQSALNTAATTDAVTALGSRVDAIAADIGTDPVPDTAAVPAADGVISTVNSFQTVAA